MEDFESLARGRGFVAPAGVDEAGRGPLAGPVAAAAVILPPDYRNNLINDSKALTHARRERAFSEICKDAVGYAVAFADPEEIDTINILQASLLAMRRAVEALPLPPDFLFVDGNRRIPCGRSILCGICQTPLVGGDGRCLSVAAASILAKVSRDQVMAEFDLEYPGYGFATHKGYPTAAHFEAIRKLGPCPIHRKTFRGVLP